MVTDNVIGRIADETAGERGSIATCDCCGQNSYPTDGQRKGLINHSFDNFLSDVM